MTIHDNLVTTTIHLVFFMSWIVAYAEYITVLTHLSYSSFLGGYFSKTYGMWGAQDGMEDGFFLLAIARRTLMEIPCPRDF